jgi:hypothetical protein
MKTHDCVLWIILVKIDAIHKHRCVGRRGGDTLLRLSNAQTPCNVRGSDKHSIQSGGGVMTHLSMVVKAP